MTEQQSKILLIAVGLILSIVAAVLLMQWHKINAPASEIDRNTKELQEETCRIAPNYPGCKK